MIDVTVPLSQIPLWPFQVLIISIVVISGCVFLKWYKDDPVFWLHLVDAIGFFVLAIWLANFWWPFLGVNFT